MGVGEASIFERTQVNHEGQALEADPLVAPVAVSSCCYLEYFLWITRLHIVHCGFSGYAQFELYKYLNLSIFVIGCLFFFVFSMRTFNPMWWTSHRADQYTPKGDREANGG